MEIVFATIAPHPPILLPDVGSEKDGEMVKKTILALESLGDGFKEENPDKLIISSPHPDWGFSVPLYFLANNFQGKIEEILIGSDTPHSYFNKGKELYNNQVKDSKSKIAFIASGDLSHCLKMDGPYEFHPDGPKFDKELKSSLENKNIENILKLNEKYPEAGECGLRSFSFLLGIFEERLKKTKKDYKIKIMSYENHFGVGYLVANFKL